MMRKMISATLAVLMVLCLLPFTAMADNTDGMEVGVGLSSETIQNNEGIEATAEPEATEGSSVVQPEPTAENGDSSLVPVVDTEDKITPDESDTVAKMGTDGVNSGIDALLPQLDDVVSTKGMATFSSNTYQRVSTIDDPNARYLIVYDGDDTPKAFTAHKTGDLQSTVGNAAEIAISKINGQDASGNSDYYQITKADGTALTAANKWYFSRAATTKGGTYGMYVRSDLNDYYLQANVNSSGTAYDPEYGTYSNANNGTSRMNDKLNLTQSHLSNVTAPTSGTSLTSNVITVVPGISANDPAAQNDMFELSDDYFAIAWYSPSIVVPGSGWFGRSTTYRFDYYQTSYLRYTDGRYNDRFVFSPSRIYIKQLLRGGTGTVSSTKAPLTNNILWHGAYGASEGWAITLHAFRPAMLTIYKVIPNVEIKLDPVLVAETLPDENYIAPDYGIMGEYLLPETVYEMGTDGASKIMTAYANIGVTDVYLKVKDETGAAYFNTHPISGISSAYSRDILSEVVTAAHANGIRIHAWVDCMTDASAESKGYAMMEHFRYGTSANTDKVSFTGDYTTNYLSNVVRDIINNYDIDGIQLGNIGYDHVVNGISSAREKMSVEQYNEVVALIAQQFGYLTTTDATTGCLIYAGEAPITDANALYSAFNEGDEAAVAYGELRTTDVNTMVDRMKQIVKGKSSNIIFSGMLRPEGAYADTFSILNYGQNYHTIGSFFDYVVPTAYAGLWRDANPAFDGVASNEQQWIRLITENSMEKAGPTVVAIQSGEDDYVGGTVTTGTLTEDITAAHLTSSMTNNMGVILYRSGNHSYSKVTINRPDKVVNVKYVFADYNESGTQSITVTFPEEVYVTGYNTLSGTLSGATVSYSPTSNVATITQNITDKFAVGSVNFTVTELVPMKTRTVLVEATASSGAALDVYDTQEYIPILSTLDSIPNDPAYPDGGSVNIRKTAEGVDFQRTGVANVELAVTGIAYREYVDVVLVFDVSGSMNDTFGTDNMTRLASAKAAAVEFINVLLATQKNGNAPRNRLALVTFSSDGAKVMDFTNDRTTAINKINSLTADGGTNYDIGLRLANEYLAQSDNPHKAVVFMTDGAPGYYNDVTSTDFFGATASNNAIDSSNFRYTRKSSQKYDNNQYYEDYFAYSTNTESGDVLLNGQDAQYRNMVKSTTNFYADEAKNTYDARVYTIGVDMTHGAGVYGSDYTTTSRFNFGFSATECATILKSIASEDSLYYDAGNNAKLHEAYNSIVNVYVKNPGSEAIVTDAVGMDYVLQMTRTSGSIYGDGEGKIEDIGIDPTITIKSYELYSYDNTSNVELLGSRTGAFTTLETVSFNATGTEAYSNLIDNGTTNIMSANGEINGKYFRYDSESNKIFYWDIGDISEQEVVLSYYVYLKGSLEGLCDAGSYNTNQSASLEYNNINGNHIVKTFEKPKMTWGRAAMTYEYYLVNENGEPVNRDGVVVGLANRVTVYGPRSKAIFLNAELDVNAVSAQESLPIGYTLHIADAKVEVGPVSDGAGVCDITGTVPEGSIDSTKLISNTLDMQSSHIAFGVLYEMGVAADVVVIDYDKPVLLDVTANDSLPNPFLEGLLVNTEGDGATHAAGIELNTGFTTTKPYTIMSVKVGNYGTAEATNGLFRYTLDKFMDGIDRFFACVSATVDGQKQYYFSSVKVVPATTVYYEDTFTANASDTAGETGIYYSGVWTTIGVTQRGETQSNADDPYGYDDSYNNDAVDSNGSSHLIVTNSFDMTKAQATFTFQGTGFDIIGRTTTETGSMIYKVTDMVANKMVVQFVVNTVYKSGMLYQIPYASWTAVGKDRAKVPNEYSTYKVELFVIGTPKKPAKIYIDAIRIYNPLGLESADNADYDAGLESYIAQEEAFPYVRQMRDLILNLDVNTETSKIEFGDAELPGIVFIDGNENETSLENYLYYGPNNEIYLNKGQSIAFAVTSAQKPTSVHVGAKIPIPDESLLSEFSFSQVVYALAQVNTYYDANGALPTSIAIAGQMVNMPSLTRLATLAIANIENGDTTSAIPYEICSEPSGWQNTFSSTSITKQGYLYMADYQRRFIGGEIDPNSSHIPANNVDFTSVSDNAYTGEMSYVMCATVLARVLAYYRDNGTLPEFVSSESVAVLSPAPAASPVPVPTPAYANAAAKFSVTVGSSATTERTISITSATNMYYDITGGINFKGADGSYTGNIIITNTSDTELLVSLTQIKLTYSADPAQTGGVTVSSNKNLVQDAIELTELRKATIIEGNVIEVTDNATGDNGKEIKGISGSRQEKVNEDEVTLMNGMSQWFLIFCIIAAKYRN